MSLAPTASPPDALSGPASKASAWRERWLAARDRLVANPRFQRWAAGNPLTRGIAARQAADLFDVCAGFVYAQVLFACVELRLLDKLVAGPQPTAALAALCDLDPAAMRRLLGAAAPLGLVQPRGADAYGLGMAGAALLGNPAVAAMVAHHALLYRDLADPVALLRGTAPATALSRFWPYAEAATPGALATEDVATYSALMSSSLALLADDVLDAYPMDGHAALLDIGGGAGGFAAAAARRHRALRVTLFDLPAVAALAAARFAREGIASQAVGGDFKRDALPGGADLVTLVRVAHDLDDDALAALLARIHAALPPGGALLLAEPMAGTPGAERVGTYFAMYLLAMRRGRPRTAGELGRFLAAAGFVGVRAVAMPRPMLTGLLVAHRP